MRDHRDLSRSLIRARLRDAARHLEDVANSNLETAEELRWLDTALAPVTQCCELAIDRARTLADELDPPATRYIDYTDPRLVRGIR